MNSTVEIVGQHPQPDADAAPVLQDHPTQSVTAIDGWRSALFGFPFLAAGVWIGLVAFGFVSARAHAPSWVIGIVGGMFFFGGLFFLTDGLLGVARMARHRSAAARRPGEPWLYDFHWHPEGIAFSAFHATGKSKPADNPAKTPSKPIFSFPYIRPFRSSRKEVALEAMMKSARRGSSALDPHPGI